MKNKGKKIELLAPAGNLAKLKTAFAFGADAVYAGIPDFSLRVRINDFNIETLEDAARICRDKGKKIFITINIFAHNDHLRKLPEYIRKLKNIGVSALIISDPGILAAVKEIWPEAEIHLSTQANCTNWQAAKFWRDQGVKRIILGREVTLDEIKKISEKVPEVELEYFVHGAMCMAYSGRCFLSKNFVGRSANLGDCAQPCRWKYNEKTQVNLRQIIAKDHENEMLELVEEQHGSYILNSKDLCLIKYLRNLQDSGVCSFKIEGRAKSVYYQAIVTGAYRQAIDMLNFTSSEKETNRLKKLENELAAKLVHRGYTTGFLLGGQGEQNEKVSHLKRDWEFCGEAVCRPEKTSRYYKAFIKVHNSVKKGDVVEIITPKYDIIKMKIDKIYDKEDNLKLEEAHGGQDRVVIIETRVPVEKYSVLRRKI